MNIRFSLLYTDLAEPDVGLPVSTPPATLTATTGSDIILTIAPSVPTQCLGMLLSTCQVRGYQLRGIRRMHLTSKKCSHLGQNFRVIFVFFGPTCIFYCVDR